MPDIKCNVIAVLDSAEYQTRKIQLRIVEWEYETKDGAKSSILLEKRELYQNEDGSEKMGKAKGLSLQDFEKLIYRKDEIISMMKEGFKDRHDVEKQEVQTELATPEKAF